MNRISRVFPKWFIIFSAFLALVSVVGCSDQNKTQRRVGGVEGQPPLWMVSMGSGLTDESEEDGTWEWNWLCQEKGYPGNYVSFTIIHPHSTETVDMFRKTAGEIFNEQCQWYMEEMDKTYSGLDTDQGYYGIVGRRNSESLKGFMKFFPNLGEPRSTSEGGGFWGFYEGKIICFRGPTCIGYVEIELNRIEGNMSDSALSIVGEVWAVSIGIIQDLEIIGNE